MKTQSTLFCLLFSLFFLAEAQAAPKAVASIKPIHSILSTVMNGVAMPSLLLTQSSPHDSNLKPSQARLLQSADFIVWVGPGLEAFLEKALTAIPDNAVVVQLDLIPGLKLWPVRKDEDFLWNKGEEEHHEHEENDTHDHGAFNPHLWLDGTNAVKIAAFLAEALGELDTPNSARYQQNAVNFRVEMNDLDTELRGMLAPYKQSPFLVFHDAFINFEKAYDLRAVGAVSLNSELKPSAKRLRELKSMMVQRSVVCVFSEPPFSSKSTDVLIEATDVRTGLLDPLGMNLEPGPAHYGQLMRSMAKSFAECLSKG
jgi:zinc transport system substrate-binding protein